MVPAPVITTPTRSGSESRAARIKATPPIPGMVKSVNRRSNFASRKADSCGLTGIAANGVVALASQQLAQNHRLRHFIIHDQNSGSGRV